MEFPFTGRTARCGWGNGRSKVSGDFVFRKFQGKTLFYHYPSFASEKFEANWEIVKELRGDDSMCKALLQIMEPEINKIVESKVQKSILNAVRSFRDLGADDKRIQEILVKNYELTPEEAIQYL